jgi:hypothetical protein
MSGMSGGASVKEVKSQEGEMAGGSSVKLREGCKLPALASGRRKEGAGRQRDTQHEERWTLGVLCLL